MLVIHGQQSVPFSTTPLNSITKAKLMLALKMSRMDDVYLKKVVCHFLRCPTNVLIQPQIVIMEHTIVWSGEGDQKLANV